MAAAPAQQPGRPRFRLDPAQPARDQPVSSSSQRHRLSLRPGQLCASQEPWAAAVPLFTSARGCQLGSAVCLHAGMEEHGVVHSFMDGPSLAEPSASESTSPLNVCAGFLGAAAPAFFRGGMVGRVVGGWIAGDGGVSLVGARRAPNKARCRAWHARDRIACLAAGLLSSRPLAFLQLFLCIYYIDNKYQPARCVNSYQRAC